MNFLPAFTSREASRNVRDFVKEHNDHFMQLVRYIAPYLLILTALSTAVGYLSAQVFAQEMAEKFQDVGGDDFAPFMMSMMFGALFNFLGILGLIFSLVSAYLYACIGIS